MNDQYNNGMNGIDVREQIRNTYQIDRWKRKQKWWWVLWMWGLQLLLVNTYLLHKTSHLLIWKKDKKSVLSQYEFCCQLVLDWLGGSSDDNASLSNIKQGRKYNSDSSSSASADSSKKAKRVNDNLCDPYSGALSMRLDHLSLPCSTKHEVSSLQPLPMGGR